MKVPPILSRLLERAKPLRPFLDDLFGLVTDDRRKSLKEALLHQALPTVVLMCVLALLYLLTVLVQPGWVTYALSSMALMVIWLTAVARVNDIHQSGKRWHVRRLGLVLCGTGAIALIAMPLFPSAGFPTWGEVYMHWGFAATWLTTPNMPPWHRYIASGMVERRAVPRDEQT